MIINMNLLRALPFIVLFVFAVPVSAQITADPLASQENLVIEPRSPEPGDTVTVTLYHYTRYIFNSDIVWELNGEVVANSNNQREIEFEVGELGERSEIVVSIIRSSRVVESFAVVLVPTYIDVVLEPQTRVPDFYKGRAVPSVGSRINATALVNNGRLLEGDLVYTWRVAGKILEGGPIRGTNKVSFDTPRGRDIILSLRINTASGDLVGERSFIFPSTRPELVFYESNALHGISSTAIVSTLRLLGNATTIVAEPYYLDIRTFNNPDIKEWKVDNEPQFNVGANPYIATIQKVDEVGQSEVSFHVRSTTEFLQGAADNIKVTF